MANNELAGPAILVYLSTFIANFKNKKYSYRFIFAPETIGAVTYISKNNGGFWYDRSPHKKDLLFSGTAWN